MLNAARCDVIGACKMLIVVGNCSAFICISCEVFFNNVGDMLGWFMLTCFVRCHREIPLLKVLRFIILRYNMTGVRVS
mgnify:CR=1 FL=1